MPKTEVVQTNVVAKKCGGVYEQRLHESVAQKSRHFFSGRKLIVKSAIRNVQVSIGFRYTGDPTGYM